MTSLTLRNAAKTTVRRIATSPLPGPLGQTILHAVQYALSLHHREVVSYNQPGRAAAAERVRKILTEWTPQVMGVDEAYTIRSAVLSTEKVDGDLAEAGVYRGTSAKVICEAKGARALHLFDTFEGLPQPGAADQAFEKGQYACSLDRVREYLKGFPNVHFHQGYFPATGEAVRDRSFAFVHLDVDLYESTLSALRFFYPRMNPGAILISHDYVEHAGVRAAVDEFFKDKCEPVIELSGNQCLAVKVTPRART